MYNKLTKNRIKALTKAGLFSNEIDNSKDKYSVLLPELINAQTVKSFCINMKDKEERYIEVLSEMNKIGVYPERFTVDRHKIEKRIKREGVNEKSNQILESHLRLYKKLSQTEGDMFLVLEDDVMVIDNINLEEVISKAPKDWDVIYLGGVNHHEGHPPVIIDDIFYKAKFTFNTHALLVKKSFIPCIIDELEKREFENDVIFAYMQSKGIGNWYGLIEDSIIQNGKYNTSFITTLSKSCFDKVSKLNGDFNIGINMPVKDNVQYFVDTSIPFSIVGSINKSDGLGKICYNIMKGMIEYCNLPFNTVYYGSVDTSRSEYVTKEMITRDTNKISDKVLITNWVGEFPLFFYEMTNVYEIAMFEAEGQIPDSWKDKWNNYCKAIIVPDEWNKENFKKSGVLIPIHVVPLAMECDVKSNVFSNDIFTFGITSQYEERKNHELVIRAFIKEFGNSKKHKLKVHGRWGHLYENLKKYECDNIEIVCGIMTENEMELWWETIDCYVLCSSGEGYSYTPREAILRGIPTIISDCTSHKVLTATKGVYGITPKGKKPAYKHIWEKVVGEDYKIPVSGIAKAMKTISENHELWIEKTALAKEYIIKNESMEVVTKKLTEILYE